MKMRGFCDVLAEKRHLGETERSLAAKALTG
jgi:hypothetical protein